MTNTPNITSGAGDATPEITVDSFELAADGKVTAPEMARVLGMNAKSFRRRLRSMTDDRAGKGGEWRVTPEFAVEVARRIRTGNGRTVTDFRFKDSAD